MPAQGRKPILKKTVGENNPGTVPLFKNSAARIPGNLVSRRES
jgi:hypothetical protein